MQIIKAKIMYFFQVFSITVNYLFNKTFSEKKILNNILDDKSIVFDIGSNLGTYIKFVSRIVEDRDVTFHSFEPNKVLTNEQTKIKLKEKHSLIINNLAVSNKNAEVTFYQRALGSSQSSLEKEHHFLNTFASKKDSSKINSIKSVSTVTAIKLDDYCKENNINRIDLLKIDTEGHEYNVLCSGENLLKNKLIKAIKIEIGLFDNNLASIIKLLNSYNYKLIGSLNNSYIDNELKFFDAYFIKG